MSTTLSWMQIQAIENITTGAEHKNTMSDTVNLKRLPSIFLIGLTVAFLNGCNLPEASQPFKSTNVTGIETGKDFRLTDHHGKVRTLSDFKGKVVIVFFGYTHCPDICPSTLSDLSQVMRLLGPDADKVQVLFITVDPERDTQELLAQYVPAFNPTFIGLYGTPEQTAATATEFRLFYRKEPGSSPENYTVDHSVGSYIYDQSGKLRLRTSYGQGVDVLAHDIKLLLGKP